ncbi:plasmid partitioning protein RepB [Sagittula salina]|uniref:Plasmid partitioning protein RepB n=1 Tax=Sagittula salina TaxID=2820268 RepID=A0A940MXM8_9RHOB|nr:plasmid partitioning protein RepB [Sagittula salina]MBP0484739.1 plasmid partitioning protein RepB [Sagittula salina]
MKRDKLAGSLKALEAHRAARETGETEEPRALRSPAVNTVADSIRTLGASAPRDVAPSEIIDSRFSDRIDVTEGLEDLVASIERSGQQLPVLLRKAPAGVPPGIRYEVVYGRRRIAACRQLGRSVRAHIAEFDDRQALVAQGLENAARLENSFIERARFAAQMDAAGYPSADICETLSVDPSGLSRMRAVTRALPDDVILAIGPAHQSGRRPWMRLAELAPAALTAGRDLRRMIPEGESDVRLTGLVSALERGHAAKSAAPRKAPDIRNLAGKRLQLAVDERRLTLQAKDRRAQGFLGWLDGRLDDLYAEWSEKGD